MLATAPKGRSVKSGAEAAPDGANRHERASSATRHPHRRSALAVPLRAWPAATQQSVNYLIGAAAVGGPACPPSTRTRCGSAVTGSVNGCGSSFLVVGAELLHHGGAGGVEADNVHG